MFILIVWVFCLLVFVLHRHAVSVEANEGTRSYVTEVTNNC